MLTINVTTEDAENIGRPVVFGVDAAPVGNYPVRISRLALTREGGTDIVTGDTTPYTYRIRALLSHADRTNLEKYKSMNFSDEIAGKKTVISKKDGQEYTIDLDKKVVAFLKSIGYADSELAGKIEFTATDADFEALAREDSWKGVKTDILINGTSVLETLDKKLADAKFQLVAVVKQGKKAPFVAGLKTEKVSA